MEIIPKKLECIDDRPAIVGEMQQHSRTLDLPSHVKVLQRRDA